MPDTGRGIEQQDGLKDAQIPHGAEPVGALALVKRVRHHTAPREIARGIIGAVTPVGRSRTGASVGRGQRV